MKFLNLIPTIRYSMIELDEKKKSVIGRRVALLNEK